jgi:hypothetical protein
MGHGMELEAVCHKLRISAYVASSTEYESAGLCG